ncbi:MAG: PEP-CTERM sorting domain-containing protein [Pacificimonas sp.]
MEATGLATRLNIVTTISGGVVLEKDIEYDGHGLERPPETVMSVPAPGAFGLLALGCKGLAFFRRRMR